LARGNQNHVFTENNNKYCCVGAQPGRAQKGVLSGLYRLKHGFESMEWDSLHKLLKRVEYAFDRYMDTDIIRHISCAWSRVNFKTMEPSPSSSQQKTSRYKVDVTEPKIFKWLSNPVTGPEGHYLIHPTQ
jgi:hypothetical protein